MVLALVLHEHPAQLTGDEPGREVGSGDTTARAVEELVAVGLLRRDGEAVLPTRAALRFEVLEASL